MGCVYQLVSLSEIEDLIKKNELLKAHERIEALHEGMLNHKERLQVQILLVDVLLKLGLFPEAISLGKTLLEMREELTLEQVFKVYFTLVEAYFRKGDIEKSKQHVEKAYEFLVSSSIDEEEKIRKEAVLLKWRGNICWQESDVNGALDCYVQSFQLARDIQDDELLAETLNNIGLAQFMKGNFNDALEYYKQSAEISQKMNHISLLITTLSNIGEVYRYQGNLKRAKRLYEEALGYAKSIEHPHFTSRALYNLGLIKYENEKSRDAIVHIEEALELAMEVGNSYYISEILFDLVNIHLQEGNTKKAKEYLEQLQAIATSGKHLHTNQQRYLLAKALWYKYQPRIVEKVKAIEIIENLLSTEIHDYQVHIRALIHLLDLLLLEFRATEEPIVLDRIIELANVLYKVAQRHHSKSLLVQALIFQAKLGVILGNIHSAQTLLDQAWLIAYENNLEQFRVETEVEQTLIEEEINRLDRLAVEHSSMRDRIRKADLNEYLAHILDILKH